MIERVVQVLPLVSATGRVEYPTSTARSDGPGDPSVFGGGVRAAAREIIARYPAGHARSALLPMLHLVQSEQGHVSPDGIAFCAQLLGLTRAEVGAVVTYYTMFKRKPAGQYLVSVCTNTLCGMLGGDEIYAAVSDELGVGDNQATPDKAITLEHAECLAGCDYAPVVTVNYEFFDNQTVDSAVGLVRQLRAGERPQPTRGAPLCTFRQIERQIAGFHDEDALAPDANGSGVPTEAGVTLALERGESAPPYPDGTGARAVPPRTGTLTPVLTKRFGTAAPWKIDNYERRDGYAALREALRMQPDELIALVKDSSLRGRGGAGFPTGMKWQFIPQGDGRPHYVVANADEGEPGTCRDLPLMMNDPHSMIEGIIIACYAVHAEHAFIYIRGEAVHAIRRVTAAVREATARGYVGKNILGSGFDCDITVHTGAGSYECGEETALLDSLEGKRGQPRLKPPFPATHGLYDAPTVVNNVGSLASVPYIVLGGADWFKQMGPGGSPGPCIYSLSGRVANPGQYEAPMGTTLRELLEIAGGMSRGKQLKFWTPGGSSTPLFTRQHLDVPLDFDAAVKAGSMNGTSAVMLFDEDDCVVRAVQKWSEFYAHESCGKCTPCREGTFWYISIFDRLEHGGGTEEDMETLLDLSDNILGRAFCALGDGATSPVVSSIQYFRDEYLAHVEHRGCPYPGAGGSAGAEA